MSVLGSVYRVTLGIYTTKRHKQNYNILRMMMAQSNYGYPPHQKNKEKIAIIILFGTSMRKSVVPVSAVHALAFNVVMSLQGMVSL